MRAVVNDFKERNASTGALWPSAVSYNDYYTFGMMLPGRQANPGDYRYGFNGKEKDDEVKGISNQQDYGLRIYDNRIGRFLSVDPLTKGYPQLTPYQFSSNRPIDGIDLDGGEWKSQHSWNDVITDKAHIQQIGESYVKGMTYQDAWRTVSPQILQKRIGEKVDCADLAIQTLVEFAHDFKLSVHFEDNKQGKDKDPTFDNDNYGFTKKDGKKVDFVGGEWLRFANNIAANYGAADLFNNLKLAANKSQDALEEGDMLTWKHPNNEGFHVQTITAIDRPLLWFDSYTTIQGNLDDGVSAPAREKTYTFFEVNSREGETIKGKSWNFSFFDTKK